MEPKIIIENLSCTFMICPWDFRVDRKSVLGNLSHMRNRTEEERIRVCKEYADYFKEMLHGRPETEFWQMLITLQEALKKYGKLRLFCWCAPKQCHVETIRDFLLGKLK